MEFLGIILPALIDLINRKIKDSDMRFWVSATICFLVGLGMNWLTTSFVFTSPMEAFSSLTSSALQVFGWAQLSYKAVWADSSVRKNLDMDAPGSGK